MFDYYTTIIVLTWMILAVLSVLIRENNRIAEKEKTAFYLTYVLIASAALAEFVGVYLNGNTSLPRGFLMAVKCADYSLTPMAGGALLEQIYRESPRERKILWSFFIGNMIFQIIASFFGWMVVIDEQNRYYHGPLYFVYVIVYMIVLALVISTFIAYGNSFRKKNRMSLYAIMILVLTGIIVQEAFDSDIRTAYLTMSVGACLMFIHYTEFALQKTDDSYTVQQLQLMTDPLTGIKSRHAYSEMLKRCELGAEVPKNFVVFSIDINGLKKVNDNLGHEAGDELIRGAAHCIVRSIPGDCFRTGGDEFIATARMDKSEAEAVIKKLETESNKWSGNLTKELHLAAGYALASEHPGSCVEELVRKSDFYMYAAKSEFYQREGHNRRK